MSTISKKEAGHTPGPWRIGLGGWAVSGGDEGGWIEADRPSGTYRKLDDGSFEEILTQGQQICSITFKGDGRANARLIAAAPDMVKVLEFVQSDPCFGQLGSATRDEVRAALSRAKGETQ